MNAKKKKQNELHTVMGIRYADMTRLEPIPSGDRSLVDLRTSGKTRAWPPGRRHFRLLELAAHGGRSAFASAG